MAITTEAGLIAARAGARYQPLVKSSLANAAAGQVFSLYRAAGAFPSQPAIPGAWATCTGATAGAIGIPVTVPGGNTLYIDEAAIRFGVAGQLSLVDRLGHMGGLNGTLLTAQTINSTALPARSTARRRWYAEWYTDTGATASNATFNVTHDDATTNTVVIAVGGTVRAGRAIELVSSAGKNIASIQQVTLSASTGTAGNFGVTCEQEIGVVLGVAAANTGIEYESLIRDALSDSPCLAAKVYCTTTSTGTIDGGFVMMQG